MKGLNLTQFKKIKSDEKCTTLKHPKGHEITIAHNGITKDMRKELDGLPMHKMADGGSVPKDDVSVGSQKDRAAVSQGASQGTTSDDLSSGWQNVKSTVGLADGGRVIANTYAPTTNPWRNHDEDGAPKKQTYQEGAADASKGATESEPEGTSFMDNIKQGLGLAKGGAVKMADGGNVSDSAVPDDDVSAPVPQANIPAAPSPAQQAGAPTMGSAADINDNVPPPTPEQKDIALASMPEAATAPLPMGPNPTTADQPANDPFGTQATQNAFMQGLGQEKTGIMGQANAMAQEGQAKTAALAQGIQNTQQNLKSYQDHYASLDQERQAFQQDLMNTHIDPQHYWASKSTGSKVSTAIGLILGGIGAGAGGTSNLAADFLQKNIERDIDAQKSDLGKKENLLSANMRQFGNLRDATQMTTIMQNDIVSQQLQQAAAKATSPLAKAQALQAIGKLNQTSASMIGQMSMRRTLMSGMAAGRVDPDKVVNLLVPENQRPAAVKELTEAQNTAQTRDNLMNAFDQLNQSNTIGNRIMHVGTQPPQVAAVKEPLLAAMSKGTAGRFTEADAKMLDPLFPAPGDSQQTIATKRNQLVRIASEKMHFPILSTYGIDANKLGAYNGQGQSKFTTGAPVAPRK